jgi:hypothetical protein
MILKKITITGIILGVGIANQLLATSDDLILENLKNDLETLDDLEILKNLGTIYFDGPNLSNGITSQENLKNVLTVLYRNAKKKRDEIQSWLVTYDNIPITIHVKKPKGSHKASEVWMTTPLTKETINVNNTKGFSDEKLYEESFKKLEEIAEREKKGLNYTEKEKQDLRDKRRRQLLQRKEEFEQFKKAIETGDYNAVIEMILSGNGLGAAIIKNKDSILNFINQLKEAEKSKTEDGTSLRLNGLNQIAAYFSSGDAEWNFEQALRQALQERKSIVLRNFETAMKEGFKEGNCESVREMIRLGNASDNEIIKNNKNDTLTNLEKGIKYDEGRIKLRRENPKNYIYDIPEIEKCIEGEKAIISYLRDEFEQDIERAKEQQQK